MGKKSNEKLKTTTTTKKKKNNQNESKKNQTKENNVVEEKMKPKKEEDVVEKKDDQKKIIIREKKIQHKEEKTKSNHDTKSPTPASAADVEQNLPETIVVNLVSGGEKDKEVETDIEEKSAVKKSLNDEKKSNELINKKEEKDEKLNIDVCKLNLITDEKEKNLNETSEEDVVNIKKEAKNFDQKEENEQKEKSSIIEIVVHPKEIKKETIDDLECEKSDQKIS